MILAASMVLSQPVWSQGAGNGNMDLPSMMHVLMPDSAGNFPDTSRDGFQASVRAKIRPVQHAVLSAPLSATLMTLGAREGSRVKKGDKLMKFDCTPLEAQLIVSQTRKKAALTKLDVNERLEKIHNVSKLELSLSRSEVELTEADIKGIRAQLAQCSVDAPFSGVVTQQLVQAREFVRAGDPVMRLVNIDDLEIEMVVPSSLLIRLHKGDHFDLHVDELNRNIASTIKYVVREVDPVSQTVRVIGTPVKPDEDLLPGMSGNVSFDFDQQPPVPAMPVTPE
ncbi:hypothetical protein TMES_15830 [Thalassospira mesophila]|uniref:Multidrug resistance protein MdtA-like barrel-sandwich hybrid domain-containing protein n=1 Tax=Thalassospira mesophila TaxID=1293891 RepID=A0A1Y2KX56_9PROT|nr:hypothetical protein TMES_15830 [Thalassospira mesophila]